MELLGFVVMLIIAQPPSIERDIQPYGRLWIGDVIPGQPRHGHESRSACEQWRAAYQVNKMLEERYLYDPLQEIAEMTEALVCVPVMEKRQ